MPKLPATVEAVVVPVTVRVPFTVVMSVMESPKVVFSTEKVEAVVVERVTMPVVVRELEKTSPSASIRNLTEPLMAAAKRLLSAVAEAGFMMSAAPKGLAPLAPDAHEEKVWARVGARRPGVGRRRWRWRWLMWRHNSARQSALPQKALSMVMSSRRLDCRHKD